MNEVSIYNELKSGNEKYITQLQQALPAHIRPDRMIRTILTSFAQTPRLKQCDQESVWKAVLDCCAIGLEPGALGHAYLLPYKGKCQLQIGYKGMIELALRSGKVSSIYADAVHENDVFIYERGTDEKLVHKPLMQGDRGKIYCYYAYAKMTDGGFSADVMLIEEIAAIRDRCAPKDKTGKLVGPWKSDPVEMSKKTALKRLAKKLPLSSEFHDAMQFDNEVNGLKKLREPVVAEFTIPEEDTPNVD